MKKDMPKKKEDILQAAKMLFFKYGFKEVTIEAVVESSRVSKRTFYKYFTHKFDLIETVLFSILEQAEQILVNLIDTGKKRKLKKGEFLGAFDLKEFDYYFQSDALPQYTRYIQEGSPDLIKRLYTYYKDFILPKYAEFITIAQNHGIIREVKDIDFFVAYSLNCRVALRNTMIQNPEMVKRIGSKKMMELFYDAYLNGIIKRESGKNLRFNIC